MIEFYHAEVVGITTSQDTYEWDESYTNKLFAIEVVYTDDIDTYRVQEVIPMNNNIKQIPLIGETVLIFQGDSNVSNDITGGYQWYYTPTVNIQSAIGDQQLPTVTKHEDRDTEFIDVVKDKRISPLQPFRGDLLIEGRWGNSIRLGSTIDYKNNYSFAPTWKGDTAGDPIILLSNGRKNKQKKEFIVESLNDNSSIYLTSTQKLPIEIKGSKNLRESNFNKSQLLGTADRIILKSKTNEFIADSPKSIVLNSPMIKIGNDQASIGIANTDVLIEIINHLVNALISGYTAPGGAPCVSNGGPEIINAVQKLSQLKSKKYFITKD
jgi:hypothetical protein